MKKFNVFYSGGNLITTISASCITKACKTFMNDNNISGKVETLGSQYATIRSNDNYSICSDYVIQEQ